MEGLRIAAVLLLVTLCVQAEDQCQQPRAPGRCMAYMERYFFNSEKGACEQFIYGGCGGNENNFETLEACQSACPTEDPCQLPKVVGRCKAKMDRFYFNALTGTCQPFVYGGCGGNANNFNTFEACQAACL